jgi:hypothetical protein
MKIRFLTMAETEFDNVVSWYQEQTEDQSLNFPERTGSRCANSKSVSTSRR